MRDWLYYSNIDIKERAMTATITEQEKTLRTLKGWQWVRGTHGCLFDRGSADNYYHRDPDPHYGGVGGDSGPRVEVTDPESVAEYMAGWWDNERFGDKKDWN
jgi:hypothetical protein